MATYGLTESDYGDEMKPKDVELYVWDENQLAYEVFAFMDTQWRVGMNGPEGLDYNVLYQKLDRMHLNPEPYEQLVEDVRTMEFAHLHALHEHYKQKEANKPK